MAKTKSENPTVRARHAWSLHSLIQKFVFCFIYNETMLFSNMKQDLWHTHSEYAAVSCFILPS